MQRIVSCCLLTLSALVGYAQTAVDYSATIAGNISDSRLAPYYIQSNNYGKFSAGAAALLGVEAHITPDSAKRLTWGAGIELWGGPSRSNFFYAAGDDNRLVRRHERQAALWLQQAYLTGRYRSVVLTLGQREYTPVITPANSSGDLTRSRNARPLPGAELALRDFRDIPLTRGWVQALISIGFFRSTDADWINHHTDPRAADFATTGYWLNHKALYLRTKPSRPVVFTIGLQAACQFGGTVTRYNPSGEVTSKTRLKTDFKTWLHSIIPGSGGNAGGDHFVEGNHIGSIDLALDWHINRQHTLRAYFQNPFEDGSGMGKLNGWDGLYGLEYRGDDDAIVSNVVAEWLTTTNQSGPIHWAPADHPNTIVNHQATGNDNYYNNYCYNGYHTAGQSIGTPMLPSPVWNTTGVVGFNDNRVRGFHLAVEGRISAQWRYRVMGGHRSAWGTLSAPREAAAHATSLIVEATYHPSWLGNLDAKASFAIDRGSLLGNRVGAMLSVTYRGNWTFKR